MTRNEAGRGPSFDNYPPPAEGFERVQNHYVRVSQIAAAAVTEGTLWLELVGVSEPLRFYMEEAEIIDTLRRLQVAHPCKFD